MPSPQQQSADIEYLVVDADCAATDEVNSRKQPFSQKSSIAVRLHRYLKNGSGLHAICGSRSTPMEGGY